MYLDFDFKANKETIKEMSEQDFSEIESTLTSNPTLNQHTLGRYIAARGEADFFAKLYKQIENVDEDKVEDAVLYYTRPMEENPLSRSTSTLSNLLDDQQGYMKAVVHNQILQGRDYQRRAENQKS